jgi:hypothetical protein
MNAQSMSLQEIVRALEVIVDGGAHSGVVAARVSGSSRKPARKAGLSAPSGRAGRISKSLGAPAKKNKMDAEDVFPMNEF